MIKITNIKKEKEYIDITNEFIYTLTANIVLQEVGMNGNKYYSKKVCKEIVRKLKYKKLFMEFNFPTVFEPMGYFDKNVNIKLNKIIEIVMQYSCAMITNIYYSQKQIVGTIKTLPNFCGPKLYSSLLLHPEDLTINPRLFGAIINKDNTLHVKKPIYPITYDFKYVNPKK